MNIVRLKSKPIIDPDMDARLGSNINGPSIIRVPDWLDDPLGNYYLYFAHHQGKFIRLAYSDHLNGPFTVYTPGVLSIDQTPAKHHIASPDVHVNDAEQTIMMHYHGCSETMEDFSQVTFYAESADGLAFQSDTVALGAPYLHTFHHRGWYYGFSGGHRRRFSRSRSLREPFEPGPTLHIEGEAFTDLSTYDEADPEREPIYRIRHVCFHRRGERMDIYYSAVGDRPERIKRTTIDLTTGWDEWHGCAPKEVIQPETPWEGVDEPLVRSEGGSEHRPVHELRDPCVHEEDDHVYLFYSVAGEQGIGVAEIRQDGSSEL